MPVIVVTLLCLWDEIFLWGSITRAMNHKETLSVAGTIAYLTLPGIIGCFLHSVAVLLEGVFA